MSAYAGAGQAQFLKENSQAYAWGEPGTSESVAALSASLAFMLDRKPQPRYYPWGMAVEVQFSGAPGAFEVDVEAAEIDDPAHYVKVGSITTVNASNVGRLDITSSTPFFGRFVRLYMASLTNAVDTTAIVVR